MFIHLIPKIDQFNIGLFYFGSFGGHTKLPLTPHRLQVGKPWDIAKISSSFPVPHPSSVFFTIYVSSFLTFPIKLIHASRFYLIFVLKLKCYRIMFRGQSKCFSLFSKTGTHFYQGFQPQKRLIWLSPPPPREIRPTFYRVLFFFFFFNKK